MSADAYQLALGGVASLALGALLARRPAGRDGFTRWLHGLLPLALFATAVAAWAAFRLVPHWNWSAARLATAVRLVHGFPLYSGTGDAAVNGWIYGPVSAIAYAPAALAREPLTALRLAMVLNALYFLLPVAVLFHGHLRHRCARATGLLIPAFAVSMMLAPFGQWYGAASLHTDIVATGLGVLSCVALVRGRNLPLAAFLVVAAAWSKQIEAVLAVAQLLYLFRARGARAALVYVGWLALAALVLTAGFVVWFGADPLWYSLIILPGGHSIQWVRVGSILAAFGWATWWVWPLFFVVRSSRTGTADESRTPDSLAPLLLLSALILLPVGVLAAAKIGGDQNSLHATVYAVLGGTLLLVRLLEGPTAHLRAIARAALLGGALLGAGYNVHRVLANDHLAVRDPGAQHREAFAFAQAHPGETYFPCNPLITLLADGRDYPTDDGVYSARLAGQPVDPAALRRLFPPTLTFVIYHEKDPTHEMQKFFPEFNRLHQTGSWDIFTRGPAHMGPASTRP